MLLISLWKICNYDRWKSLLDQDRMFYCLPLSIDLKVEEPLLEVPRAEFAGLLIERY